MMRYNIEYHQDVASGKIEAVKRWLAAGIDVDARDAEGGTPLHSAVICKQKKMVEFLIEKGADVNATDKHGATPLHQAAWRGDSVIAGVLLEKGADIDAINNIGYSSLHEAAVLGNTDVVDLLIERGADVHNAAAGFTPALASEMRKHQECATLLREAMAKQKGEARTTPRDDDSAGV